MTASSGYYPPITESVDHPDVCEYHTVFPVWYDDGDPESGPGEPYLYCPECWDEQAHPIVHCEFCHKDSKTVRTSLTNVPFDPTTAYHLECGHVMI